MTYDWLRLERKLDGYPPPPRHACLTFGGTWSVPGTGYCSWVVGAADNELVFEVPVEGPYTFGPIPGATRPSLTSPSYRQSIDIAVSNAIGWIKAHPRQTFLLGGYSMGGEAASRVLNELAAGGELEDRADDFIGGFTFGNPSREAGHTFPGGRDGGQGISSFRLVGTPSTWNDYANTGDIYTTAPTGEVGDVMEAAYNLGIDIQLNDPLGFMSAIVHNLLRLLDEAGLDLPMPNIASIVTGAFLGFLRALSPKLRLGGDNETAAAVEAAVLGLRFIAAQPPTAPHITYEFKEAAPGVTFLEHARRHVNACCRAVKARAAA